jgi:predicted nucleic acid-binding protein
MRSAVDTNVLSAIWDREPSAARLTQLLDEASRAGSVVLCAAVYAEALAHPRMTEEFLEEFLRNTAMAVDFGLDERVWLEAGRAYARYAKRRRRSAKEQPKRLLADFVIGAHAMVTADRLVTLDRTRYERDFPGLKLV